MKLKPISEICLSIQQFEQKYSQGPEKMTFLNFKYNLKRIANGNFGIVYESKFQNREIIVKKVEIIDNYAITKKLLKNEINTLNALKENPNFQRMIECVYLGQIKEEINGPLEIYILGDRYFDDLHNLRQQFLTKLTTTQRIQKYIKLAKGLQQLHDIGFAHSDFKPENIMSSDENFTELKIIDLGMATEIGDHIIGGTPYYKPVVENIDDFVMTSKLDVFSLAMTIIKMEIGFQYTPVFSTFQLKQRQNRIIEDFKKQNKIFIEEKEEEIEEEEKVGFFTKIWNFIKSLFGFKNTKKVKKVKKINNFKNFNELISCMTESLNKNRCSMHLVIDTLKNWDYKNVKNEPSVYKNQQEDYKFSLLGRDVGKTQNFVESIVLDNKIRTQIIYIIQQ